jgi:hypothetical protein
MATLGRWCALSKLQKTNLIKVVQREGFRFFVKRRDAFPPASREVDHGSLLFAPVPRGSRVDHHRMGFARDVSNQFPYERIGRLVQERMYLPMR